MDLIHRLSARELGESIAALDPKAAARVRDTTDLAPDEAETILQGTRLLPGSLRGVCRRLVKHWSKLSSEERTAGLLFLAGALLAAPQSDAPEPGLRRPRGHPHDGSSD